MSYDITLLDPKTKMTIHFKEPHFMRGGTYCANGTTKAWLNITYNYSKFYYEVYPETGIRQIYGLTGDRSIPVLQKIINSIREKYYWTVDDIVNDYWEEHPSNAIKPLYQLIEMAKMRPNGIWDGD